MNCKKLLAESKKRQLSQVMINTQLFPIPKRSSYFRNLCFAVGNYTQKRLGTAILRLCIGEILYNTARCMTQEPMHLPVDCSKRVSLLGSPAQLLHQQFTCSLHQTGNLRSSHGNQRQQQQQQQQQQQEEEEEEEEQTCRKAALV